MPSKVCCACLALIPVSSSRLGNGVSVDAALARVASVIAVQSPANANAMRETHVEESALEHASN